MLSKEPLLAYNQYKNPFGKILTMSENWILIRILFQNGHLPELKK